MIDARLHYTEPYKESKHKEEKESKKEDVG
jgi:hypothetical protein